MMQVDLTSLLPEGDVLLIVPPFMRPDLASLGVHVLQACAREAGFRVGIFYANMACASWIGEADYFAFTDPEDFFLGERIFAAAAYGARPLEQMDDERLREALTRRVSADSAMRRAHDAAAAFQESSWRRTGVGWPDIRRIERKTHPWADEMACAIARKGYKVVGCTSMFDQTTAAVALLARAKDRCPGVVTILGGTNCEGDLAGGLASLTDKIDYIFSGESDATFPEFLSAIERGDPPRERILHGGICLEMDGLPTPSFDEFFEQRERLLSDSARGDGEVRIPYEASRGCWWGQGSACKFCGFTGERTRYRAKSPDKVVRELASIASHSPTKKIAMSDNVLSKQHLVELFGKVREELPDLDFFYTTRTTLSLREALALKAGGVTRLQPGVESLSTSLLGRMRKGVTARTNIAFLRYARIAGLIVYYNLLWGFPGDKAADYEEMIDLLPRLHHLPPPKAFRPLLVTRFSTYFREAAEHGITHLRPRGGYEEFLPPAVDAAKIAWNFVGDFECESFSRIDLIEKLNEAFETWRSYWLPSAYRPFGQVPKVEIVRDSAGRFRLLDTRDLPGCLPEEGIDRRQASYALVARPVDASAEAEWALWAQVVVVRDGWLVPLATSDAQILLEFEDENEPESRRPAVG